MCQNHKLKPQARSTNNASV